MNPNFPRRNDQVRSNISRTTLANDDAWRSGTITLSARSGWQYSLARVR